MLLGPGFGGKPRDVVIGSSVAERAGRRTVLEKYYRRDANEQFIFDRKIVSNDFHRRNFVSNPLHPPLPPLTPARPLCTSRLLNEFGWYGRGQNMTVYIDLNATLNGIMQKSCCWMTSVSTVVFFINIYNIVNFGSYSRFLSLE